MQLSEHENEWLVTEGAKMIRELGVPQGSAVIDFGCGIGRYSIPISQAAGEDGIVFAMERNASEIDLLKKRIEAFAKHAPIEVCHSDGIDLQSADDCTIDALFAFDVLQYVKDWDTFFASVRRVLKPEGRFHVYPAAVPHPDAVDLSKLKKCLNNAGFTEETSRQYSMMHNKDMVEDSVYTFHIQS